MVFGVFDGLHPGHHHFLEEAGKYCTTLVVVVAHPEIVGVLKQRAPLHSLEKRMDAIRAARPEYTVIAGDSALGTWSALKHYQPDIILLGYDQEQLAQELEKLGVRHTFVTAHHPEKYKSTLLNKKLGRKPSL